MTTDIGIRSVEINDADFKALVSTYIEVVPAPGAGKALFLMFALFDLNASAGAYTFGADATLFVGYGDWDFEASIQLDMGGMSTQAVRKIASVGSVGYVGATGSPLEGYLWNEPWISSTIENAPLKVIGNDAGNFTGGNAANTLKVTAYYITVDL